MYTEETSLSDLKVVDGGEKDGAEAASDVSWVEGGSEPGESAEILADLRRTPKRIASKFLYDQRGSELFDLICELPEYYPTRTETAIMKADASDMIEAIGAGAVLIELGSGSSAKTRLLLDRADSLHTYVPVDISADYLAFSAEQLKAEYPNLNVQRIAADYTRSIPLPAPLRRVERKVAYFPGSTFGNFYPEEGVQFLGHLRKLVGDGGGLLIGLDWRKNAEVLDAAYNDSQGVTAAFNLNILNNVNRLADSSFREADFSHLARFNSKESRIEIFVVSKIDQQISVGGEVVSVDAGEAILTEVSYKYTPEAFLALADEAGFTLRKQWSDPAGLFGILYLDSA